MLLLLIYVRFLTNHPSPSRGVARLFAQGGPGVYQGGHIGERSEPISSEARAACRALARRTAGSGGAAPSGGLGGRSPPENFLAKMGVFRGCESDFSSEIAVNSFDQNCN